MNTDHIINLLVDMSPFVMYTAVLWKIWHSWSKIKAGADTTRQQQIKAVLILLCIVTVCLLVSNAYALVVSGKTYLSIRVFQIFMVANCVVNWLVIDILTKDSIPEVRACEPSK